VDICKPEDAEYQEQHHELQLNLLTGEDRIDETDEHNNHEEHQY